MTRKTKIITDIALTTFIVLCVAGVLIAIWHEDQQEHMRREDFTRMCQQAASATIDSPVDSPKIVQEPCWGTLLDGKLIEIERRLKTLETCLQNICEWKRRGY